MKEKAKNILIVLGVLFIVLFVYEFYEDNKTTTYYKNRYEIITPTPEVNPFKIGYMQGCTDEGASVEYCECTYEYLEARYTLEEMGEMGMEYGKDGTIPDEMWEASKACISLD